MPYSGDVQMRGGFLLEAAGELDVTLDATGAFWDTGFLRSPLGELVVTTSTAGATWQGGFLRAANGALVVEDAEPTQNVGGLARTASGALAVENTGAFAMVQGKLRTATGRIAMPDLGGSFSPANVSGLAIWLKADAIIGLADGDPVTTWEDSSTNNRDATQATSASKPTYKTAIINGKPVVRFDGVDDLMASSLSMATKPLTAFVVAKFTDFTVPRTMFGASVNGGAQFRIGTDAKMNLLRQDTALIGAQTGTIATATPVLCSVTYSGAGAYVFYEDGTADGSGTNDQTFAASTMVVGRHGAAAQEWMLGDIAEILFYDSVLSTTDRDAVEDYLGDKYGITVA
jgi:hypothetical protein